jgi:hypothetical protein
MLMGCQDYAVPQRFALGRTRCKRNTPKTLLFFGR